MKKFSWIIGIAVVVLIGGAVYIYSQRSKQGSQTANTQTAAVTRGTISAVVSASGSVRSMQSADLNWQTSGQISAINVQAGQTVQADQVLASLAPTSLPASVLNAEQTLIDAKKNLQDLQQSNLATAQAQQALANAQKSYNTALAQVSALGGPTNADALSIKTDQADLTIAQAQLDKLTEKYGSLAKIQPTNVHKAQAVTRLSSAQQKVDQTQQTLDWAQGHPTTIDLSVAQGNLVVAKAQLEDAQRQYDLVKNGPSADDLAAAQAAVDAAQATVNQARITAPFSGTVTEVDNLPGDLVSAGTPAFQIDNQSAEYVDVVVSEVDINRIQIGQAVQLTFDAVPNHTYNGKVTNIVDVGTSQQGVVNFPVTVQITDADAQVKPGMTAAVSIVVAKDSNVLLVPNQAVRSIGNQHTVTVLYQGQLIPVQVTVGLTDNTNSEITGGQLREGDAVVLNPPASSSNSSFGGRGGFPGGGFLR